MTTNQPRDDHSLMQQVAFDLSKAPQLAEQTMQAIFRALSGIHQRHPDDTDIGELINATWDGANLLRRMLNNQIKAMHAFVAMSKTFMQQRDEYTRLYNQLATAVEYQDFSHPLIEQLIDSIRAAIQGEANAEAEESVYNQFARHAAHVIPGLNEGSALDFINAFMSDGEFAMTEDSWQALMDWLAASVRLTEPES